MAVPVLADLRPAGRFLMEDFYYAGGLRALLASIPELLDLEARTVSGQSLGQNIAGARVYNAEVILRACAAVRLRLREHALKTVGDEALETGELEISRLPRETNLAFSCYVFLATLQEVIIQHLDESILGG